MSEAAWRKCRNDRQLRYAGRVLDESRWVLLRVEPGYASSYEGQVAVISAANMLARMTPSVVVDAPAVKVVSPLPWAGHELGELILGVMGKCDPGGRFELRSEVMGDYVVHLGVGQEVRGLVAHGAGWKAYLGAGPSPVPQSRGPNPFGAAFSAVMAVAHLFISDLGPREKSEVVDTLSWSLEEEIGSSRQAELSVEDLGSLGDLWVVGVGSVGTAVLYFLTLLTREFSASVFDMDDVKIENLDRSPIFFEKDVGEKKADVTACYLRAVGVRDVVSEAIALDEARRWSEREVGTPDLVIASANERNVRYLIETAYPPLQVYGTTGKNWQAASVRHLPFEDSCSCCLFPESESRDPVCGGGKVVTERETVDGSLPFLSFAAGLMAAADIVKLRAGAPPRRENVTVFSTKPGFRFQRMRRPVRKDCVCGSRNRRVHERVLEGTRYGIYSSQGIRD